MAPTPLEMLQTRIEEVASRECSGLVGFADLSHLKGIQIGDPTVFEFPSAVSYAVEIPKDTIPMSRTGPSAKLHRGYLANNERVLAIGDKIVAMLTEAGYNARFVNRTQNVDQKHLIGPISQKAIAAQAGLGWIGRNGLFMTDINGARQRLGAVLTDMPVLKNAPLIDSKCGECTICIDNCPMKALKGARFQHHPGSRDLVIDWVKCGENEDKLLDDRHPKVCGNCISTCPFSFPGER
ncbi:MAG: 4Fe-4S dicluster domain-containing protein [Methanomassiliicoccales archaeon]|nr:4Fe-4S dicluster domain-containing protein [Methanomassiliicoccales archaeon]